MCGVFGICAPGRDVARLTYFGLHALQHRGQESAGIAVSEQGRLTGLRDLGLVAQAMTRLEGAATVVGLADGRLFGFRDPHGFRPLVLGRLGADPVLASETCALDLVGAELEREVRPGELVLADGAGTRTIQVVPEAERGS